MDEAIVELEIFSPRWGHTDTYEFIFSRNNIVIKQGARIAKCEWIENRDAEWSGDNLYQILNNDSIYPPENFQRLIENAWEAWRDGELDNTELNEELKELEKWLNIISETKPKTDFWIKRF
ncbi:MAG: hypothetical protein HY959_13420 [Ignavibacteriae bacterium]|nr:hypothetical protein [Ignavibacteriota bacterium]